MVLRCLSVRRRGASGSVHRMSDAQHTHDREIKNLSIFFIYIKDYHVFLSGAKGPYRTRPEPSLQASPRTSLCGFALLTHTYGGGGKAPKAPRGREGPSALPANRLSGLLRAEKRTVRQNLAGVWTCSGAKAPRCGDPLRGSFTRTLHFTSEYQISIRLFYGKVIYMFLNRILELVQTPLYVYLTIEEASLLNEEPGEYLIYSLCQDSKDIIENLWDYIS